MKFIENLKNVFKIEELRNRIMVTLGLLLVYRFGAQVVLPGIDASKLGGFAGNFDAGPPFGQRLGHRLVGGADLGPLAKQCRIIEVSCRQCVLKSLSLHFSRRKWDQAERKTRSLRTPGKRANVPFAPLCPVIALLRHLSNFTCLPTPR